MEYAEIHTSNNKKFKSAGERLLFAADVRHHKSCYNVFRSPRWNKKTIVKEKTCGESSEDELLNLIG